MSEKYFDTLKLLSIFRLKIRGWYFDTLQETKIFGHPNSSLEFYEERQESKGKGKVKFTL